MRSVWLLASARAAASMEVQSRGASASEHALERRIRRRVPGVPEVDAPLHLSAGGAGRPTSDGRHVAATPMIAHAVVAGRRRWRRAATRTSVPDAVLDSSLPPLLDREDGEAEREIDAPAPARAAECVVGVCVHGKALARVRRSMPAGLSGRTRSCARGSYRAGQRECGRRGRAAPRASPVTAAVRARLDEHVAERGRLDGAGEHGQAGAVGGALAEQLVERARRRRCGSCARRRRRCGRPRARRSANACASDSDDAAGVLGAGARCGRSRARRTTPSMRPGMSPGAQEARDR